MGIRLLLASLCIVLMIGKATSDELRVLAAGSLREVLGEIGKHYEQATGTPAVADFGPSGLLRERIEKGEHADLFASADMGHPLKLLRDGRATRVAMFTRNTLCAVAVPQIQLTTANFLDRLLDPAIKLGTSTPRADPAGDYTWAMFRRADAIRPGAYEILDKKAQQIVGGPANNAPVDGKDPAVVALAAGRVDIVIAIVPAPSCGCRKWQNCRSRWCRPRWPRVRNTAWHCSEVPIRTRRIWRSSCCRPTGSRCFPAMASRRWPCRLRNAERCSHFPIEGS